PSQMCVEGALGDVAVAVGFAERGATSVRREEPEHVGAGVVLRCDEGAPQQPAFASPRRERAKVLEEEGPAAPARAARDFALVESVGDGRGEVAAHLLARALAD